MARADLPDKVMANLLKTPEADETILTRWSHCALTDSPAATLGRGLAGDIPAPEVNARSVLRFGDAQSADYFVVDKLGEGGMGIVFEAEQVYFRRRVALKMIKPALASDPAAVKAFFREAVITSRLDHPGIIPVLDFGVSQDGRALYAMMKASGVPWHRVMRNKTLSENVTILDSVADVVAHAHGHGILHRDIKPANVILGNHGEVWLGDWGVALARSPDGTYFHAAPAGTPQYMAPEMARCDVANIGVACDIYLLGAVLFEIITGSPPHDGENARAALLDSAHNAIHPTDQTNGLLQIAYKAMAARPDQRFASVGELREAMTKRLRTNESIHHQQKADMNLSSARKTGDYEYFQQAIAGYDQAIALSPENMTAKQNRIQALVEYADKALAKNEFELAASIVQSKFGVDKRVARMMQKIATKNAASIRRRRWRTWFNLALAGMVIVTLAGGFYLYFERRNIPEQSQSAAIPLAKNGKPDSEEGNVSENTETSNVPLIPENILAEPKPPIPPPEKIDNTEQPGDSATVKHAKVFENHISDALFATAPSDGKLLADAFKDFPQCVLAISTGEPQYDASAGKIRVDVHIAIDKDEYNNFVDTLSALLTKSYGAPIKTRSTIQHGTSYGRSYISIDLLKEMLPYNISNRERFIFLCTSLNDSRTSSEWLIYEPGKAALHNFQKAVKYKELYIALTAADGRVVTSTQTRLFYPASLAIFHAYLRDNVAAILPLLQDLNFSPTTANFSTVQPGTFNVVIPVEFDVSPEEAKRIAAITWEVIEVKNPIGFKAN